MVLKSSKLHLGIGIACGVIAIAAIAAAIVYSTWSKGGLLPDWIEWNDVEMAADLDDDGAFEIVSLKDRKLSVLDSDNGIASTPDDWFVSDVFVADMEKGDVPEIICLAWKKGSFGPSKPFWVENDDWDFSEHVAIFHLENGKLRHHWVSSDIGIEVASASMDDESLLHLYSPAGEESICEWQGWGLKYIDEGNPPERTQAYDVASMLVVGDAIPHEGIISECVAAAANSDSNDDEAPGAIAAYASSTFGGIARMAAESDIAVVNQETPLAPDGITPSGDYRAFAAPREFAEALESAGFDTVLLANNHMWDQGPEGIAATHEYWNSRDEVAAIGLNELPDSLNEPAYVERNGITFGLVNSTLVMNDTARRDDAESWRVNSSSNPQEIASAVAKARENADVVACFLHAGEEYSASPAKDVEEAVEAAVDAGADIVVCSHPHVVQKAQKLTTGAGNTALVCYSLGNILATQPYASTVLGSAVQITVEQLKPEFRNPDEPDSARAEVTLSLMTPTVCHSSNGKTAVHILADYDDKLAASHYVNKIGESLTKQSLLDQWRRVFLED